MASSEQHSKQVRILEGVVGLYEEGEEGLVAIPPVR